MHLDDQFESLNPSDGSVVWRGPAASLQEVEAAVLKSRAAFDEWSRLELDQRKEILRRFAAILGKRKEELAELIAREIGKPLWESRTEVDAMAGKVEISIKAHDSRCGEFKAGMASTRFRPHGVLAVIGPYNFPAHLPNGHICPALLAGNTVLFKPSELAPATGDQVFACWKEAGLPDGVMQILQGGAATAIGLTSHSGIDGVLFTGSAATGKKLAVQMSATPGKILALEMGGNNPLIVDSEFIGDLEAAAEIALRSSFLSAGQRCTCARRLIVIESSRAQSFIDTFVDLTGNIAIDDPFADPQPFMGPLAGINFPREILLTQSARVDSGGISLLEAKAMQAGTGFLSPGIIDVSGIHSLPDEEIFGPVAQILRIPDLESAILAANDTRFGLAAGILTDDVKRYEYACPRLWAGIINWNVQLTGASSAAPFGGIRDSGNLRPSAFFAADYCAYPVASMETPSCQPQPGLPGRPD
jgi:succinylglutamic semialdehyde dehydrogenase